MKSAVLSALGQREEMTIDELRAVLFSAYSEAELMRRGTYRNGKKSQVQAAYICGHEITPAQRAQLANLGLNQIVHDIKHRSKWMEIDETRKVARRVRQ